MNIEEIREYCISKPGVTEGFPFNDTALVFKVIKIFAILDLSEENRGISLKCDPERAIELRSRYEEVQPGYHLNKQQWNTINTSGRISRELMLELIDHSYELIVASLKKAQREELENMGN